MCVASVSIFPGGSMVELQTSNLKVAGSSPVLGTNFDWPSRHKQLTPQDGLIPERQCTLGHLKRLGNNQRGYLPEFSFE